ncbi:MAG: peptide deformylase [marine bacterium B5-7]|nr:MAG: peptide deformylase [marine bacterium B5-7]
MALLDILVYPDPRLRRKAVPVTEFDDDLRTFANDMAETMYAAPGIGLAAIQVNDRRRVIVVDVSENHDDLQILVNPEIISSDGSAEYEEGCLSVPGVFAPVSRAEQIRVKGCDVDGSPVEFDADGLLAICIQHEIDHLNGKVFVDYLSRLKQDRIRKKLVKEYSNPAEQRPPLEDTAHGAPL